MPAEDILTRTPPRPDERVFYGADANQFMEVRLPRGQELHPVVVNIHGGFWRAKYDLIHAGHLCEAFRDSGIGSFNVEYRRIGNPGGGWPGTFEDIRTAYRYIQQEHSRFHIDLDRLAVIGHSAGGQLALCLASQETSIKRVISLAGVVDLIKAFSLHLSNDAVVEFLGGKPGSVPEHYREADPMEFHIPRARQWLLHGLRDDIVPPTFSRDYATNKRKAGESIELVEIPAAGHFDLIDPMSPAFKPVLSAVLASVASRS